MRALQIIESEEDVMDQGAGSSSCQPVTFPRLGRQLVLFRDEALHVPIDKPPWSVNHKGSDRFKCSGCGKAVAWRNHGLALAADLLPHQHISAGQGALTEAVVCGQLSPVPPPPCRHDGLAHGCSDLAPFL
jgi:hypothetical protein